MSELAHVEVSQLSTRGLRRDVRLHTVCRRYTSPPLKDNVGEHVHLGTAARSDPKDQVSLALRIRYSREELTFSKG